MILEKDKIKPYTQVIIELFKGAVYSEDKQWSLLLQYKFELMKFFSELGLELIVQDSDGYAYLLQIQSEEGETLGWIQRRKLSYEQSVFCILLRGWLNDFEMSESENRNLLLQKSDLRNRMEIFFKDINNQEKLFKDFDKLITEMNNLGFLKKLSDGNDNPTYEVRRILKSKVTIEMLEEFKNNLIMEDNE
ncbi:MAG: DUF4194 domain-containing protein [Bacteroidales bacterium]